MNAKNKTMNTNNTFKTSAMFEKNFIAIILIAILMSLLSGCVEEYTKEDVRNYIIKEYGFDNFTISDGPEEVEGEDGYTDLLWTITLDAEETIVFHVLDDRW